MSNIFAAIQEALDDDELTNTNDIGKRTILSKSVVGSQRYFKTAYYVSFLNPCFFQIMQLFCLFRMQCNWSTNLAAHLSSSHSHATQIGQKFVRISSSTKTHLIDLIYWPVYSTWNWFEIEIRFCMFWNIICRKPYLLSSKRRWFSVKFATWSWQLRVRKEVKYFIAN